MSHAPARFIGKSALETAGACRVIRVAIYVFALLFGLLITCEPPRADGRPGASATIARTLLDFVHVATPDQARTLEQIAGDAAASRTQRALADALRGVFHTPAPEDLPILRSIIEDAMTPPLERTIARVIYDFKHVLTAGQRKAIVDAAGFGLDARDGA